MHPPTLLLIDESLRKSQLNAVTDPKLKELLLKCCSTKPDQRPSAAECVDALNNLKNRTIQSVTEKLAKLTYRWEPEQFWSIKKLREQLFPFPTPTNRVSLNISCSQRYRSNYKVGNEDPCENPCRTFLLHCSISHQTIKFTPRHFGVPKKPLIWTRTRRFAVWERSKLLWNFY